LQVESLALNIDGLKITGVGRAGTLCHVVDNKIKMLTLASKIIVPLIVHSPDCFGKTLDYLRFKQLNSLGILAYEPALPEVQDLQKKRFEKVIKYYFLGHADNHRLTRPLKTNGTLPPKHCRRRTLIA
jgi:hypothetical protein